MAIKSIGYAFPTSTYATRLNASRSGCYFVETKARETSSRCTGLFGPFATLDAAEAYAGPINAEWSAFSRRAA